MEPELFDERSVVVESVAATFWVEIRRQISSQSPIVESYLCRDARFDAVVDWARQASGRQPDSDASVWLLSEFVPSTPSRHDQWRATLLTRVEV